MAPTETIEKATSKNKSDKTALSIPLWFMTLASLAIGLRIHVKLDHTPPGQGIAWLTPAQYNKQKTDPAQINADTKNKDLIYYEFTAAWCSPCKKRERTTFANPQIIKQINDNFIPVRVDLSTELDQQKPENKALIDEFNVTGIPLGVVTLKSGEFVRDDHYYYSSDYAEFLKDAKDRASTVQAELLLAQGDYAGALAHLAPAIKSMEQGVSYRNENEYIVYHHVLCRLSKPAEVEAMMEKIYTVTAGKDGKVLDPENGKWVAKMNKYLRGQLTEKELLEGNRYEADKAACLLAIGLKALRENNKEKARKTLQQAAIANAKSYRSDKLAEYFLKEIDQ